MDSTGQMQALLEQEPFNDEALNKVCEAAFASDNSLRTFSGLVNQRLSAEGKPAPAEALRLGLSLFVLGRLDEAATYLEAAPDSATKWLYLGRTYRFRARYDEARKALAQARKAGTPDAVISIEQVRVHVAAGQLDEAEKQLQAVPAEQRETADWYVAMGLVQEARGLREQAVSTYEHALDLDPDKPEALFRLAALADLSGDEDAAIEYYETLVGAGRVHVNALLNLAVLYEDQGMYEEAGRCVERVLDIWPDHERARLFIKDIDATDDMVIDEDIERFREKRSALFDVSIADFELSVRARNCLQSMGINTLGDLLRVTEEQLLAYKNFGDTSLDEIKQLLTSKGLRLGQALEEERKARQQEILKQVQGDPAVLVKPVSDLQLSVRARKALQRLNIQTIGELAARTESELLAVKNFGQTSLNEIRQRLAEYGLTLRKA